MNKTNLIEFFIVGKNVQDNKIKIMNLKPTNIGWIQNTMNDKSLNREYVSQETVPDLLEWFKCDFFQYRMFHQLEEAQEYANEKMKHDIQKHLK